MLNISRVVPSKDVFDGEVMVDLYALTILIPFDFHFFVGFAALLLGTEPFLNDCHLLLARLGVKTNEVIISLQVANFAFPCLTLD